MDFLICDAPMKWREKKEQIQKLRRDGFSYQELMNQLPFKVAKGTVSRWCKEIELTPEQLGRLDGIKCENWYRNRLKGSKSTQWRRAEEVATIKAMARKEIPSLTRRDLWIAGLMLYLAEGGKTKDVTFSNSDLSTVRFMMKWFREICRVPEGKFKSQLNIHSGQDDSTIKDFWSKVTGIPLSQFGKSYIKKEGTGHRKNILYHGTIKISVCNRNLFYKIIGWTEGVFERSFGPLAQLAEQGALNAKAAGSIPARPIDLDDNIYVMDRA